MERKLRKSYLIMFPLFLLASFIAIMIGTWISAVFVRPSMASSQYTAKRLMEEGIPKNLVDQVVEDGGNITILHKDGRVELLAGDAIWNQKTMTLQEITDFLVQVSDPYSKYKYSVAYNEDDESWLVVSFPVSIRIQVIYTANHTSKEYVKSLLFYIILTIALTLSLFLIVWCYAKKSSKTYSVPLHKVCSSVRQIAKGNYLVEEQKTEIEEYKSLQEDVMELATLLKEEKHTTQQLEESKRQMLLDISHDLRNPLATILGYSETLYQEDGLSEKERENYIEVIYRNSMRAHKLMDELFEYTRLDQPTLKMDMKTVDLCEFLREFIASYVPDIESARFESEFEIPESELYASIDEKEMERALGNMIQNSLRYNQPGTKLSLTLLESGPMAEIHILDHGVGMDSSLCESIFQPFTRADKARNSKLGGSGLGLSISKKIIEAHHGTVQLMCSLGHGCDFKVLIPLVNERS